MATDDRRIGDDQDDFLTAKKRTWSTFTQFSTYSIVAIAILLILMAIFLI